MHARMCVTCTTTGGNEVTTYAAVPWHMHGKCFAKRRQKICTSTEQPMTVLQSVVCGRLLSKCQFVRRMNLACFYAALIFLLKGCALSVYGNYRRPKGPHFMHIDLNTYYLYQDKKVFPRHLKKV